MSWSIRNPSLPPPLSSSGTTPLSIVSTTSSALRIISNSNAASFWDFYSWYSFTDSDLFLRNQSGTVCAFSSTGQLCLGSTNANTSALLDVTSTTKGVLFPRMTTAQKNAIGSPAAGLVVFDTTLSKLCVYTGAAWQTITSA